MQFMENANLKENNKIKYGYKNFMHFLRWYIKRINIEDILQMCHWNTFFFSLDLAYEVTWPDNFSVKIMHFVWTEQET